MARTSLRVAAPQHHDRRPAWSRLDRDASNPPAAHVNGPCTPTRTVKCKMVSLDRTGLDSENRMDNELMKSLRVEVPTAWPNWQRRLLSAAQMADLARKLALGWFTTESIQALWSVGLLRADLIFSEIRLDLSGLECLPALSDSITYAYTDLRIVKPPPGGFGSSFAKMEQDFSALELRFHPDRVYVLHHINRTFGISIASTQFLSYEPGVENVARHELESLKRWSESDSICKCYDHWNNVAELTALAEPYTYGVVHYNDDPDTLTNLPKNNHFNRLALAFKKTELGSIHSMRQDLVHSANSMDDNRSIHVLLRCMKPVERQKLKGHLGCAVHFLAMAETLRRMAELVNDISLPEEDEIGSGQWFPGARKMIYGTERIFDARTRTLREFLNHLGLDFAIKVRCYVEGPTEYGALAHAFQDQSQIQLINLAGGFVERGGRGLAFSKSLEADKAAGIFSIILLDGDSSDNLRVVKKSAREERHFGLHYISNPDFELGNFSHDELVDIALQVPNIGESGEIYSPNFIEHIKRSTAKISSGKELFRILSENGITHFSKSELWGQHLMRWAIDHPNFPCDHPNQGEERPVFRAAKVAIRAQQATFSGSLARYKIDPDTGQTIPRTSGEN